MGIPRTSAARRTMHNSAVEALRQALPLNKYLFLLHQGATMGMVPVLDEHGNATGAFTPLRPIERIDTIKYLIDKAMPSVKAQESLPAPEDIDVLDADTASAMSGAELRALTVIRKAPQPQHAPESTLFDA
jgi:hypothetical protein